MVPPSLCKERSIFSQQRWKSYFVVHLLVRSTFLDNYPVPAAVALFAEKKNGMARDLCLACKKTISNDCHKITFCDYIWHAFSATNDARKGCEKDVFLTRGSSVTATLDSISCTAKTGCAHRLDDIKIRLNHLAQLPTQFDRMKKKKHGAKGSLLIKCNKIMTKTQPCGKLTRLCSDKMRSCWALSCPWSNTQEQQCWNQDNTSDTEWELWITSSETPRLS